MKEQLPPFKSLACAAALLLAFSPLATASVTVLDFSNGNGTSSVDQYEGIAGGGWSSGWSALQNSASSGSTAGSTGVTDTNPLYAGGDNYLKAGFSTPAGLTGTPQWGYYRQLDSGAIDLTQEISYHFYFRPENSLSDADYFIYSRVGSPAVGSDSNATWLIYNSGTTWRFSNGNGSGGFTTVDTGITVTAGVVYEFTVISNPVDNTYTANISSSEGDYSSSTLNYRNTSNVEGEYLQYAIRDKNPGNADEIYFSVDNIGVTQIPETNATAMLIALLAFVIAYARRRANRQ